MPACFCFSNFKKAELRPLCLTVMCSSEPRATPLCDVCADRFGQGGRLEWATVLSLQAAEACRQRSFCESVPLLWAAAPRDPISLVQMHRTHAPLLFSPKMQCGLYLPEVCYLHYKGKGGAWLMVVSSSSLMILEGCTTTFSTLLLVGMR